MEKIVIDKSRAERAFAAYVAPYDPKETHAHLKLTHTHNVAALCERIARALSLDEADCGVAWLIGLLHDIGRFEQWKRFGAYRDSKAFAHASYGADILFRDGLIRRFTDDDTCDALIECAIRRHSDYALPDTLSDRERVFCDIVRDADKIDIIRIAATDPLEIVYETPLDEALRAAVTDKVAQTFLSRACVDHAIKRTSADYLVGDVSLCFVLARPESGRILSDMDYLSSAFQDRTTNPETKSFYARMTTEARAYLKEIA